MSGESVWERGGLKDFVCGVVMLDEMMDEVMMMGEVMVGEEVVVVEVMMGEVIDDGLGERL